MENCVTRLRLTIMSTTLSLPLWAVSQVLWRCAAGWLRSARDEADTARTARQRRTPDTSSGPHHPCQLPRSPYPSEGRPPRWPAGIRNHRSCSVSTHETTVPPWRWWRRVMNINEHWGDPGCLELLVLRAPAAGPVCPLFLRNISIAHMECIVFRLMT